MIYRMNYNTLIQWIGDNAEKALSQISPGEHSKRTILWSFPSHPFNWNCEVWATSAGPKQGTPVERGLSCMGFLTVPYFLMRIPCVDYDTCNRQKIAKKTGSGSTAGFCDMKQWVGCRENHFFCRPSLAHTHSLLFFLLQGVACDKKEMEMETTDDGDGEGFTGACLTVDQGR